jgi:protein-disulfide isomerase
VQTGPLLDEAYAVTGKVVNVFRNFPLDFHPNAIPAAKAAYCAGQQDPKLFWAMHDWLFETQDTWAGAKDAADQLRKQAVAIGADGAKYDACLTDAKTDAAIQRDQKDGAAQGVRRSRRTGRDSEIHLGRAAVRPVRPGHRPGAHREVAAAAAEAAQK